MKLWHNPKIANLELILRLGLEMYLPVTKPAQLLVEKTPLDATVVGLFYIYIYIYIYILLLPFAVSNEEVSVYFRYYFQMILCFSLSSKLLNHFLSMVIGNILGVVFSCYYHTHQPRTDLPFPLHKSIRPSC